MGKRELVVGSMILGLSLLSGCSALKMVQPSVPAESETDTVIQEIEAVADTLTRYEDEEALLETILIYHTQAQNAFDDFDFGTAETKIDSAFMFLSNVDIENIEDEDL
ncbi:hypothetical protein ACFL47_03000, partial [Candidatus Latescibacterota bacterium]